MSSDSHIESNFYRLLRRDSYGEKRATRCFESPGHSSRLDLRRGEWHQPAVRSLSCSRHGSSQRVKEDFEPTPLLSTRTSCWDDDTTVYHLAKDILAGKAEWLEDGIIKMPLA